MKKRVRLKVVAFVLLFCAAVAAISAVSWRSALKLMHPKEYTLLVDSYAAQYGLDADLVYAVIKTESSFDEEAVSSANAKGLMQITPETFLWLQTKLHETRGEEELMEPEVAIQYGCFFLKLLMEEFGDEQTALAAYHQGRGKVNSWLREAENSADGKTLDRIPSQETGHYIDKVTKAKAVYEKLY